MRPMGASSSGPGVVLHVPMLWAAVLVIAAVLAVVLAYNMGFRNGGGSAGGGGAGPQLVVPPGPPDAPEAGKPGTQPAKPDPSRRQTGPGATDNNSDPRVKGYKYFVLAHPSTERAPAMVEFCRTNGLDAYLVPDDNTMLRKIIVLPGYKDSSEKSSEPIRKLEAEIKRVGEKWKNAARGNKDFSDVYPELYR